MKMELPFNNENQRDEFMNCFIELLGKKSNNIEIFCLLLFASLVNII